MHAHVYIYMYKYGACESGVEERRVDHPRY